jgi:hypothetical protein
MYRVTRQRRDRAWPGAPDDMVPIPAFSPIGMATRGEGPLLRLPRPSVTPNKVE